MKKEKNKFIWMIPVVLTAAFMLIAMAIIGITPFGDYSFVEYDCLQQYMPFFAELHEKFGLLGSEGISAFFYSFNGGLGYNFLAVFFYYLASPLNLIIAFVSKESLLSAISILIVVKLALSAGTMGIYLSHSRYLSASLGEKIGEENGGTRACLITAFSLGYALSSFMLGYGYNIMWLDAFMLFPIVMLGLERFLQDNKPVMYIISLFFVMSINYYIAFMICIFLVLWVMVNQSVISPEQDEKKKNSAFLKLFGRFVGASVLSAGLAAVPLIVSAMALINTEGASMEMSGEFLYGNAFSFVISQFMFIKPIKASAVRGGTNLYSGVAVILLTVLIIFSKKNKNDKLRMMAIPIIMFFAMSFGPLNFIWHGFHEQFGIPNRFAFMLIFTLLVYGYEIIHYISEIGIKRIIIAVIFVLILPFGLSILEDYNGLFDTTYVVAANVVLIIIYAILLISISRKKEKANGILKVFSLIMSIELLVNAVFAIKLNDLEISGYYMGYVNNRTTALQTAEQQNNYRVGIYDNIINNEDTYQGIHGISLFCSTQSGGVVDTMHKMGLSGSNNSYYYAGSSSIMDDLLGVRYVHMNTPYYTGRAGYETLSGTVDVTYENTNALYIGYAVNKDIMDFSTEGKFNPMLNQNNLLYAMTGEGGYVQPVDIQPELFAVNAEATILDGGGVPYVGYTSDGVSPVEIMISLIIPETGEYMIDVISSLIYQGDLVVNGNNIEAGTIANRVINLNLNAGDSVMLHCNMAITGETENAFPIIITRYNPEIEEAAINYLGAHQLNVNEMKSNRVLGTVEIPEGQMLFTSIPYDKGWKAYVDGHEVSTVKLMNAFVGVDTGAGSHTVEFVYTPVGLVQGIIIAAISWILFILLIIASRKNGKKLDDIGASAAGDEISGATVEE